MLDTARDGGPTSQEIQRRLVLLRHGNAAFYLLIRAAEGERALCQSDGGAGYLLTRAGEFNRSICHGHISSQLLTRAAESYCSFTKFHRHIATDPSIFLSDMDLRSAVAAPGNFDIRTAFPSWIAPDGVPFLVDDASTVHLHDAT